MLVNPAPAHAAGQTIFLSATSGPPGTRIEITGQGFANGHVITIKSTVGSATVDWFKGAGVSSIDSLTSDTPKLTTTAAGDFNTMPMIPDMPGGAQTITVSDGTSSATATITITRSLTLTTTVSGDTDTFASGYPEQIATVNATVRGFGASESVTVSSTGVFSSFAPTLTTSTLGKSTSTVSATIADSTGGSKNVVATGQTSGLTASAAFQIMPWVAFYNSQSGATKFSFLGKAPTSVLIEGHGFTAGSIAANSITVGGVSTTSSAVTVGSTGTFGAGVGNHLVVAPNSDVPFGQVSVVVQGNTFNLANGNINQWAGTGSAGPVLGGVFESSIIGTTSSTAVASLNAGGYGYGDTPVALGYGFVPGGAITANANGALTSVTLGTATNTIETGTADSNGAIFVSVTGGTSFGDKAAGSYTATFTGGTTANIISPSFIVHQVLTTNFDTSINDTTGTIDFLDGSLTLSVHGFTASTAVTVAAGGATLNTATITTDSTGKALNAAVTNPDLAQGTYTATATDGTYSANDTFTMTPLVAPTASDSTLTVLSGGAGSVTSLRTVTGVAPYGVHGLKANTAYDVNWGMVQTTGANVIGSFTSTATGGIPLPGVQITVPAGSAGNHVITIIEHATGTDALFNTVDKNIESENLETFSQYGDLVFTESITAIAAPTVVNVGQTFTLSGTGLFGATTYYTTLTTTGGASSGQLYSQFTTDASGSIPAATSLTFPPLSALSSSCSDGTAYPEKATSYYVHLSQSSQIGIGGQDGQALVILSANAATNTSTVAAGRSVTLTANGLCASQAYNIIFNYATNGVTFTGQTVSAFVTNTVGSGSGVFTVPASTAPGSYVVQLQRLSPTTLLGVLNVPPTLTVTGTSIGSCNTTSCLTLSGSVTKDTKGILTGLDATFTNSATSSVTGIVYAVVHNSIGQTVYYTTATVTPSSSGTATAFLVLSGLPAGTYTVTIFATDTSGNAISVSTTTSVTLP